jgi:hypothetical protein
VKTLNDEERKLARSLAQELDRLTLLVADKPNNPLLEPSPAARISAALCRLDPVVRRRVLKRTRKAVARALKTPPPSNPSATGPVAGTPRRKNAGEVDRELLTQARQLLRKRWEAQRATIGPMLQSHLKEEIDFGLLVKTTVEMQLSGEVVTGPWFRETELAGPVTFDFRWRTSEPGAARCYWQLIGPITSSSPGSLVASGYVPGSPDQVTPGSIVGYFTIALMHYLPPTPPQAATTYHVRVLPLGPPPPYVPHDPFGPTEPTGIGPWSQPAIIKYGKEFQQGSQQFDIGEVYRKAHFYLDWMRLVIDQPGSGTEEFHIAGFVHQQTASGSTQQTHFGPYYLPIDPDDDEPHTFGKQATFHLNNPDQPDWPRSLIALITIMEEDDGGALADWHAALQDIANDMIQGAIAQDINAFLNDLREEIEKAREAYVAAGLAEALSILATAIAASAKEYVSAIVAALVGGIIASIQAGASDDYYGTEIYNLTLFTNEVDLVEADAAGHIQASHVASGGDFAGSTQADGSYRLDQTVIRFYGAGHPLEGSPISGIVEIGVHWEFKNRELI